MKYVLSISLMFVCSLLGSSELPGWPVSTPPPEGVFLSSPLALDLDCDGTKEIVTAGPDDSLRVFSIDGSAFAGFPVGLSGDVSSHVAAGPVTGTSFQLVVLTTDGTIDVFDRNGSIVSPFPIALGDSAGSTCPVLWDFDGDGAVEIVAHTGDSLHVIKNDGSELLGFPVPVLSGYGPATSPSVGDFTGDSDAEIVAVGYEKLYAYKHDGTILPGFPIELADSQAFSYSSPILLDLDGDDTLEICACYHSYGGSNHGYIAVWGIDGEMLGSWPIQTAGYGSWIYGTPAAGDIDGDGLPEIVLTNHNGKGYVINGDASSPEPWSMSLGIGALESSPLLCDFNGDAGPDILFLGNDSIGSVACYSAIGAVIDSFPWESGAAWRLATPFIDDIDDDGDLDICAIDIDGSVHLYDYKFEGMPYSRSWIMGKHDPMRTGWLHPEPPDTVVASSDGDSVIVSWKRIIDRDLQSYNLYTTEDEFDSSGGILLGEFFDTTATIAFDSSSQFFFITGSTQFIEGEQSMVAAIDSTTNIAESFKPQNMALDVYPNPFNSAVTISISCHSRENGNPEIEIFDLNGRMVYENSVGDGSPVPSANVRGDLAPTEIIWQPDATIGSGVYLVRSRIGDCETTKRIIYLK